MKSKTKDNKFIINYEKFDSLLPEALKLFIENNQVSTSMLQRRFSIGFLRVSNIIDQMEDAHFISKADGVKLREIYITKDEYYEIFVKNKDKIQKDAKTLECNKTVCNDFQEKKDNKKTQIKNLTRGEIDRKLEILRKTSNEDKSYKYLRPTMAMCYCMSLMKKNSYKISLICSGCKEKNRFKTIMIDEMELNDFLFFYDEKVFASVEYVVDNSFPDYDIWFKSQKRLEEFRGKTYSKQNEKIDTSIEKYNEEKNAFIKEKNLLEISEKEKLRTLIECSKVKSIIAEFKSIGLDAELMYNCADCDWEKQGHFTVRIKAKNEQTWNESIPKLCTELTKRADTTNINEYRMVLNFLKHKKDSINELNYENIYVGNRYSAGLIKTEVDIALQKVLDLKIHYTKKEIANNIKVIFEANNLKSKIDLALEILKLKSSIHNRINKNYYLYYLEKEEKINYIKFCENVYNYFKNGFITKGHYTVIIKELYENACKELKITGINSIEEFKEYFIKHQKDFVKYTKCMHSIRDDYSLFLKREAERLHLKTYQEFAKDYIASENYRLSLDEYIMFMQGLRIIFDSDFNDDGVYKL